MFKSNSAREYCKLFKRHSSSIINFSASGEEVGGQHLFKPKRGLGFLPAAVVFLLALSVIAPGSASAVSYPIDSEKKRAFQ